MAALTEEQSMLKDQATSWVTEQAPVANFRAMRDTGEALGFDTETWQTMVEMGWTGILIPEAYGGSDLGYLTFGVVLEQLGRELTASPLFSSALVGATAVLLGGGDVQKKHYLPKIVDGSEVLTLAVDEGPRHAPQDFETTITSSAGGFVLNGAKTFVPEGMAATTLVVAAQSAGESTLVLVPADAAGITRERLQTVDSRGYANVRFDGVELGPEAVLSLEGGDLLEAVLDRARAGLGMEMLGTALRAFDMTVDYLKTREQFGRVIGSFQALGHRAAALFMKSELSRSCAEAALQAIDTDAPNVPEMSSLSMSKVGDFLHEMSNQLIQIHGGIGMTDQFDAGFYLKRARVLESLYGNQAFHRDRYARLLGF